MYTKLVIYMNKKMFDADPYRKQFPLRTATTPSTAVIDLLSSDKPIGLFLGQQASSKRGDEGHCWAVIVWKNGDIRNMIVRDSNVASLAKVSLWTRELAKKLGISTITLVPTTREERSSNDVRVILTYLALADLLDGSFLPDEKHESTRIFDVASNEFEDQMNRKRKLSKNEVCHPPISSNFLLRISVKSTRNHSWIGCT
jgi:hypothetical protein